MSYAKKTKARNFALKFLYQCEAEKLFYFSTTHFDSFAQHVRLEGDVKQLTHQLAHTVLERIDEVDGLLKDAAHKWSLERMASTDRAALRIAVVELLENQVPVEVVLNEAIKLAKAYGTENSGKFVNGVLDALARKIRG